MVSERSRERRLRVMETATTAGSVAGGNWMPLAEAAVIEGVKPLAIRRRIEAGTMAGERRRTAHGWRWFVRVQAVQASVNDQTETAPRLPDDVSAKVGDVVATDAPSWSDVVTLYEARIADLRTENDRLRADHTTEAARMEAIIQTLQADATDLRARLSQPWWRRLIG